MKVKIGNYRYRMISSVHDRYMRQKYGYNDWPETQTRFENSLEKLEDALQWVYNHSINLVLDRRSDRSISVRIDPWDTWSMDHTLAPIILPMLVQLKATKHGAPQVDVEDVPKELRPSKKELAAYNKDGTTDENFFKRWDWVLDEMIWAFEQKCRDDWESDYTTGEYDFEFKKIEDGEYKGYSEMVKGPNHTAVTDWEGRKAHQSRMSNGFRLFGKYYEALWD